MRREEVGRHTPTNPDILAACAIAVEGHPTTAAAPLTIRAAHREYSATGVCYEHWWRLVWRGGAWLELAPRELRPLRFDVVMGQVWPGELVIEHWGAIRAVYLVCGTPPLVRCRYRTTSDGLRIELPDGHLIMRPHPRRGPGATDTNQRGRQ
jgi:hypothetical protein